MVAVPCHAREPGVGATVRQLLHEVREFPEARVVVCINGPGAAASPAARVLRDVDAEGDRLSAVFLDRASKPAAWNRLREEPADITVFCDADVILEPGSIRALVDALVGRSTAVVATGRQRPAPPQGVVGRIATVPFRLEWGGVAGTLYAARHSWLPEMPEDVLLDDAWLWAKAAEQGGGAVVAASGAVAIFRPAESLRDLWRQRVRAQAGKRQIRSMGLSLAPAAQGAGLTAFAAYPLSDWPAIIALGLIKLGAAAWSRVRPVQWRPATSTKADDRPD